MYASAQNALIEWGNNYSTPVQRANCVRRANAILFFHIHLEGLVMNPLNRIFAVFVAIVFLSALGCAGSPTQESTGEYITDSWITTKVKAALADDRQVKATEVNVETFKGVVQLSGFVSSDTAMYEAVRIARGIKGVKSVNNDMRVK